MKCNVLHRQQKFPEGLRHLGIFAPRRQQKINREHEEKVDTDPAKAMHFTRERKPHDAGVINDDNNDRERAEKIETWLTFTTREARIDSKRGRL